MKPLTRELLIDMDSQLTDFSISLANSGDNFDYLEVVVDNLQREIRDLISK